MTTVNIDFEQVDRDFGVAVRQQIDAEVNHPWREAAAYTPETGPYPSLPEPPAGLGTTAMVTVLAFGLLGTAACVVGLASAVHTAADAMSAGEHADVRYDLICTAAWILAGTAGILAAIGIRRSASPDKADPDVY